MRRVLIFPLCLILTLIICSQAWGAVWYVVNDNGTIKYTSDSETTEYKSDKWSTANATDITSLKDFFSLTELANDDVVYMKADTFSITEAITITKDISVYGGFTDNDTGIDSRTGTTTIDCGNNKRVITIGNSSSIVTASVLLDGLTITKGNASNGGGIYVDINSTAIINNCTIKDNTASENGGGVYANQDAIVIIANCSITVNKANNGGGIYANTNTVADITNCTITGNKAKEDTTTSGGGGLYIRQYSTLTLANCTITSNEAKRNGGGLYTDSKSKLTITNCTIVDNSQTASNGNGKEICNAGRTIMTNTFVWNSATDKAIRNDSGMIKASHCAAPDGITGITANENGNITIASWSPQTSDNVTVNGVTHTVYTIENNQDINALESKGTSEGAPAKDQLGNTRASPPCIGAVERVYAPTLSPADTLTINDAIEGKAITPRTITATQGAGIVWSATGELPVGLTATSTDKTCTISGVPETGTSDNSPYTYTITATNSKGSDDVTVTVNVSAIPILSYSDSVTLTEGEAMTDFKITAIAGNNLTWSTTDTLPSGLSWTDNDKTYTISGTPASGTAGTHSYSVTATNTANTSCTATATITIIIKAAAEPTLLDSAISYTAEEDSAISPIRIIATSGNNLEWSGSGDLPEGLTVSSQGNVFTISGTPAGGTARSTPYTYTVKATNIAGTKEAQITITVKEESPPVAPVFLDSSISYTCLEEWEISPIRIFAKEGNKFTWSESGELPDGLKTLSQGNIFTIYGTPSTGTSGSYSYTVKAANSLGSAEARITITVKKLESGSSPSAPVLLESTINYTGLEGWEISPIRIIAMAGNNLEWSSSGPLPEGLQVSSKSNVFTIYGTPAAGTEGSYSYTVKAKNSLGSAEAKITITVKKLEANSSPSAPVLLESAINYTGLENWEISPIKIIAMAGNNLEWSSSGNLPEGLHVSSNDRVFTIYGTPATGTEGSYSYTVKAKNSLGSAEAKITITVKKLESNSSPSAPVLLESTINYTGLENWEISPIRIIATAGNNLEWSSSGNLPGGLQVSSNDRVFTIYGTPATGTLGSYSYTVKAANSLGSAEAKVTITIKESSSGSSAKPVLSEPAITYTNQEGYTIEPIIIKAVTGDNLTWSSSGSLPAGLSGAESDGKKGYIISGAPAMGTAGKYSYTVTAKNDIGEASTLVTIIVEKFELEGLYEPSENTTLEDYFIETLGLSREQLYTITSLKLFANITSLDGIADLVPNLKILDLTEAYSLGGNLDLGALGDLEVDEVNISGNPALKALALRDCKVIRVNAEGCENLVSIDIAGSESIEELILDNTNITEINARGCKNLRVLHFANSRVSKIDLTGCDNLQDLDFKGNRVRRFHTGHFDLNKLTKLNADSQRVYVPLIEKVFNFGEFLLGHDDYDSEDEAYLSGIASDTGDNNLGEVTAYDESGNEIDYDNSKYQESGEFIFDKAPAKIVYEYETGLTSMDVTITGTPEHDDDSFSGSSGGCDSGLSHGALLALMWLVFEFSGRLHFFMRRNIFVVLLALVLIPITSSQIHAASAWYVINDNGAVKYAQAPTTTDYQSGKWSSAASTAESLTKFFADTVQADDRVYMRADEFTIANPVVITKNVTLYGGFKDSDSGIDSRTEKTTIKGGTNFKGSIIKIGEDDESIKQDVFLDGLTITGGNSFRGSGDDVFDDGGGGVHLGSGTLTMTNCTVTGNTAAFGGGVFNYGTMTIANCTVSGNKATDSGGGIYNRSVQTITNCVISDNTAEINGGGIDSDNNLTIVNCTVSGNSSFHGGGISNHGFVMTVTNCTIVDNKAKHMSGGVYNTGEKLTITNCTITGNTSEVGPGIANDWGLTMKNTLVWSDSGDAIYNYNSANAWINASYCAFPSGTNVKGITFDEKSHNIAITSWNTRAVHEAEVDGVTHKVFEIDTNGELSSLEGAGTSDGAPDKDQIGRRRSNPPCIGAADTGKVYAPVLDSSAITIEAVEGKSITAQTVKATRGSSITWSMSGTLPTGLTGSASESGTSYTISGKLAMGTTGSYSYTLTAKNNAGEASTVVNINIAKKVALDLDKMTEPTENMTLSEYLSDYSSEQLAELTDFKVPVKITNLEGIADIMPKLKTLDLTAADSLGENLDLRVLGDLQLEKVILSGNPKPKTLSLKSCDIQIVNAESCKNLETLEVAGNEFIEELYVGSTDIREMNASGCKNLKILHFPNARVKEINLTGCSELRDLDFHNNHVRSFNKDDFGLNKLEKLNASGQKEEVDEFKLIFDLMKFILGKNNNNNSTSSAVLAIDSAVSSGDENLIDLEAYDESGNYIAYDDSDYARLGEIIFDEIPSTVIYYYDTGVNYSSMDMTISLAIDEEDYEKFWGGSSSSGGCDSGFAFGALLALTGFAFTRSNRERH